MNHKYVMPYEFYNNHQKYETTFKSTGLISPIKTNYMPKTDFTGLEKLLINDEQFLPFEVLEHFTKKFRSISNTQGKVKKVETHFNVLYVTFDSGEIHELKINRYTNVQ